MDGQRGAAEEQAAADFLVSQGLRIVARNWRCKGGELDVVAMEGDTLVFVEVRARASVRFGGAAASITASKQTRLIRAAQHYLTTLARVPACRFDAVLFEGRNRHWLKDIIQL